MTYYLQTQHLLTNERAAKAIIHAVETGDDLKRLALGADAYEMITTKLSADLENYKNLKDVTTSTAFDDASKGKLAVPALV